MRRPGSASAGPLVAREFVQSSLVDHSWLVADQAPLCEDVPYQGAEMSSRRARHLCGNWRAFWLAYSCLIALAAVAPGRAWAVTCGEVLNLVNVNVPMEIVVAIVRDSAGPFDQPTFDCLVEAGVPEAIIDEYRPFVEVAKPVGPSGVRGTVWDTRGRPAGGARLVLRKMMWTGIGWSVATDETGGFEFQSLPHGEYSLRVDSVDTAGDHAGSWITRFSFSGTGVVELSPAVGRPPIGGARARTLGERREFSDSAQPSGPGRLRGVVWDTKGTPMPDVRVELEHEAQAGARWSLSTGPQGTFDFPALPVGSYRLRVVADGYHAWLLSFTLPGAGVLEVTPVLGLGQVAGWTLDH